MNYVPTSEELKSKTVTELHVIFRNALLDASSDALPLERLAALKTIENVRRCLAYF